MKIIRTLLFLIAVGTVIAVVRQKLQTSVAKKIIAEPQTTKAPEANALTPVFSTAVFVPYWTDRALDTKGYDTLAYFGITPNTGGIDTGEPGYSKLEDFTPAMSSANTKYLTVRMTNQAQSATILQNQNSWDTIVDESLNIAEKYKFNGVVLDIELSPLSFKDLTGQVTDFVAFFYSHTKGRNLKLAVTVYGDTIYRHRPYDLEALSRSSDEVWVMAYDFHKTNGLPGPNFPLGGREKYGYDFRQMIDDMVAKMPASKLRIIFGMYGYDWLVDDNKKPFARATSLTLSQIQDKFLDHCTLTNCVVQRDPTASEQEVNYVDKSAFAQPNIAALHIIWVEDEVSVRAKMDYARGRGVDKMGYFAYGYF